MDEQYAIKVDNITKKFKIYYDKGKTLKEKVLFSKRRNYEERTVLDGISFKVKKGEAVGLIGHNGCGKSTTLKMLSRIMYPDSGSIEMNGRVSSLIELGAGFHPDMSGRENIYINASIFGLTKKEIDKRLADIIEFSELEEFIDNPVRTYSSGMYMRLAFSVAINVDADILLIDEILAVGDANFQVKCFNRLREIKRHGTTIVIVSHSLTQIEQICERSYWIHEGKVAKEGNPIEVHSAYLKYMGEKRAESANIEKDNDTSNNIDNSSESNNEQVSSDRWGTKDAIIEKISFYDKSLKEKSVFNVGEDIEIKVSYRIKKQIENAIFGIAVYRSDGLHCYGTNTYIDQIGNFNIENNGTFFIKINNINLLSGVYLIDIAIQDVSGITYDYWREAKSFEIYSTIQDSGIVRIGHEWEIT